ncbi:MAG: FlgD Ig-like domain, partial [Verrucomicrobiota bacterium]
MFRERHESKRRLKARPRRLCRRRYGSTSLGTTKQIGLALLIAILAGSLAAQDSPAPAATATPSPAARNIRISFVPPPLDGTISLGIYDAKGKLVRVLFREADINEFTIGHDALSTTWDGKDDAGENVPPGKYSAHGFVVGDLKIEGVGFSFNDWISSPDAPRFSHIHSLGLRDDDLFLGVDLVPPGMGHVLYNLLEKTIKLKDTESIASPSPLEPGPGDIDPVMTIAGRDGTRWVIDRTEKGSTTTEL